MICNLSLNVQLAYNIRPFVYWFPFYQRLDTVTKKRNVSEEKLFG